MMPMQLEEFASSIVAVSLFVSNIFFAEAAPCSTSRLRFSTKGGPPPGIAVAS